MRWRAGERPWIIGHRGAPMREVENTVPSFQRALDEDGADALELDLCMTRDGEIVLWHDWSPAGVDATLRRFGLEPDVAFQARWPDARRLRRRVSELDLDDVLAHFGYAPRGKSRQRLDARVTTLDEALAFTAGRRDLRALFLDVKMPEDETALAPAFMARVERLLAGRSEGVQVIVETSSPVVMEALKAAAPHRHFALDVGPMFGYVPTPRVYSAVRAAIRHENAYATLMRPPPSILRPFGTYARIARHDQHLRERHNAVAPGRMKVDKLIGFTVNDPREMTSCLALGFDGIMTNYPSRLAQVVEELDALPVAQEDVARLHPALGS